MHASTALAFSAAAIGATAQDDPMTRYTTGALGNATVVDDNPVGDVYVATLPDVAFDDYAYPDGGNAQGSISAEAKPDGEGIVFTVRFSDLPTSGGPFLYHIHQAAVPEDGNCTATGGHLDPFQRLDNPACNSSLPETCEVGDLSGKYGKITTETYNASFTDLYASTNPDEPSFIGNLSFVLHYANKTRISCANFELEEIESSGNDTDEVTSNLTVTASPSATETPSPTTISAGSRTQMTVVGAGLAGLLVVAIGQLL